MTSLWVVNNLKRLRRSDLSHFPWCLFVSRKKVCNTASSSSFHGEMKFDDVLREIGEFGSYQKRVYILATLPLVFAAFEAMSVVFIFHIPPHRCAIPGYADDRYHVTNTSHLFALNATIPKDEDGEWSKCHVYSDVSPNVTFLNQSDVTTGSGRGGDSSAANTSTCDRWVYDRSVLEATIPQEFNIVCDRSVYRASSNMLAELGCLLGTLTSGILADKLGRKLSFYLGGLALGAGGFGIAFSTSFLSLNICRFVIGIARMALMVNGLVLGMEIVGPSKRVLAGIGIELTWCVGMFILLLLAFLIRQWRYLEIAVSVPSVFLLAYWWLIPDSPRWLAAKGREEEALKVLKKITASNRTSLPKADDVSQLLEVEHSLSFRHVFRSRELVMRVLILFCNMFVVVVIYYALMYNITNLAGDIFLNYLFNTIVETVGLTSPYFLLDRLGRKKVYLGSVFAAGVTCVACVLPALFGGADWIIVTLSVVGRFFVCIAFSTLYIYGTELFPTVIRASTISVGVTFSRLGGIVAPYLADVGLLVGGRLEKALPLIIMGTPALVVGLLSLWLPETKGTPFPETLDDIHAVPRQGRKCLCGDEDSDVDTNGAAAERDAQTTSMC